MRKHKFHIGNLKGTYIEDCTSINDLRWYIEVRHQHNDEYLKAAQTRLKELTK